MLLYFICLLDALRLLVLHVCVGIFRVILTYFFVKLSFQHRSSL